MAICLMEVNAQSTRYWSTNLNEESSLLAGAVVGGGAGVGAIYFNPGQISANTKSNLSINASLFSLEFNKIENGLGDNIDLKHTRFFAEPRFFSYIFKSKNIEDLTYQLIAMGKQNFLVSLNSSYDAQIDILRQLPGNERYYGNYNYRNHYMEYWLGAGASYKSKSGISIGVSMFGIVKSLYYKKTLTIDAHPLTDSVGIGGIGGITIPFYVATTSNNRYIRFDDYRLMWKIGAAYTLGRVKLGLNVTTPSIHIFSGGKAVSGRDNTSNIMNPDGLGFLPDNYMSDEQVKKEIKVNYRDPFSIALGAEYIFPSKKQFLYITAEYYFGIKPYKFVTANENPNSTIPSIYDDLNPKDWLSYASGAKPILNIALGYKWELNEDLLLLSGFKTDFSYLNDYNFGDYEEYNNLAEFNFNVYHFSGGLLYKFLGHTLFTGIQYSYGEKKNMTQLVNMSDPVEYNEIDQTALQGVRENNMKYVYNGVSLFFGVTFNFGNKSKDEVSE